MHERPFLRFTRKVCVCSRNLRQPQLSTFCSVTCQDSSVFSQIQNKLLASENSVRDSTVTSAPWVTELLVSSSSPRFASWRPSLSQIFKVSHHAIGPRQLRLDCPSYGRGRIQPLPTRIQLSFFFAGTEVSTTRHCPAYNRHQVQRWSGGGAVIQFPGVLLGALSGALGRRNSRAQ